MAITYDFIVYSRRISATGWILGMKAIHGEVPLDIVVPDEYGSSDSDNSEVVGVLTTEGLERESTDGMELYLYLRRLNPKKNDTFGYNEVVIRNIHARLNTLRVDEEVRVQVTYSERKEPYTIFSYHIKLIGIFGNPNSDTPVNQSDEIATPLPPNKGAQLQDQKDPNPPGKPAYKTTNTLEKLITFTQNLQKELTQTRRELAAMAHKIQRLEEEQQQFSEIRDVIQDIFDRLDRLDRFGSRIQDLEADRHQLSGLQQAFQRFLAALHQQTRVSLQAYEDETEDQENERD